MNLKQLSQRERDAVIANQLSMLTKTLCLQAWNNKGLDRQLRKTLLDCLGTLEASALIAHFVRERTALKLWVPSASLSTADIDEFAQIIEERRPEWRRTLPFLFKHRRFLIIGSPITQRAKGNGGATAAQTVEGDEVFGYSALIYRDEDIDPLLQVKITSFHGHPTVGLLFQVLHHRVRLFLPFPALVAERYWIDAAKADDRRELRPPWEAKQPLRTVTLSFDLRKSTFCMENADDFEKFAKWLDQLVRILTRVTHLYGGIFDKFTGDGGLVHFLEQECQAIYGRAAIECAVECGVAMQKATRRHIQELRKFLRLDSKLLGGAIGIDVASAHWSLDHRHNPVTVGRGVVNACRLGDPTPANGIRLTNIAYHELRSRTSEREFQEVPFLSKEFPETMQITAWQMSNAAAAELAGECEVREICDEVYRTSDC